MDKVVNKYDQRQLVKSNSLANWSFIGTLVPIVGWTLASIGNTNLKTLEPTTPGDFIKIQKVHKKIKVSLILSISICILSLIFGVWYANWSAKQQADQVQQSQQQQVEAEIQAANSASFQQLEAQGRLQACLDNIDKWYSDNSQGLNTDAYWTNLLELRRQYTDDCKVKNPVY